MLIMYDLCEQIAKFRNGAGMTQSALAKKLGVTRAAVNAWEMGLSIPQLKYVVEMSRIFHTTLDSMLSIEQEAVDISGLGERERALILNLVDCLKDKEKEKHCDSHDETNHGA